MTGPRKWLSYLSHPSQDGLRPIALATLVAVGTFLGFLLWAVWAVVLTRGTIAQWTHDVFVLIATILGMLLLAVILTWIWKNRYDILWYIETARIRVRYFALLRAGEANEPPSRSALEIGHERQRIMQLLYYYRGWQRGVDLRIAGNWKARELEWLVGDLIAVGLLVAHPAQALGPTPGSRAEALIEFVKAVNIRYYSLTPKGRLHYERLERLLADAYRQESYQNQIFVLGNLNQIQVGTYQSQQMQMWVDGYEEN
jgi:hypothetical protein